MKKASYIFTATTLLCGSIANLNVNVKCKPHSAILTSNSYSTNFSDFHEGYYANIVKGQAQNPENVDINVNYSEYNGQDDRLKDVILSKLNSRYWNYFNAFAKLKLFTQIESEEQIQFCDPQNHNKAVFNDFNITNLDSLNANPAWGFWKTFNLKLVYWPNKTSFEFSLNLCHFDVADYSGSTGIILDNTQNLPTMQTWKDIYHEGSPWYFFSSVPDDGKHRDVVFNLGKMIDSDGVDVGSFQTAHQAGFFLDPLSYTYALYIHQEMFGHITDTLSLPKITVQFDLSKLQTTSWTDLTSNRDINTDHTDTTVAPADMPYDSFNNPPYGHYYQLTNIHDSDHASGSYFSMASQWYRGSIHKGETSDATEVVAYTEADNPSNVEIINAAISGGDNFLDGYHDYLEFWFYTYGMNLTTGFNDNVFNNSPASYQLIPNSIVDYSNFIHFTNQDGSQINIYGYKNDVLNNYYTYAIENSDKNTLMIFNNTTTDKVTINDKSYSLHQIIDLHNLIINNQPTLLRIKITPKAGSTIANSLYYGYDSQDNTINFNIIDYPAHYPTFHNYIDFNRVDNSSSYNRDLKIHIDGSLITLTNNKYLELAINFGFLETIDWSVAYNWKNYQGLKIDHILNKKCFNFINCFVTNPSSKSMTPNKNEAYTKGFYNLLQNSLYLNHNIVINVKFNYDPYSQASIYNDFSPENPNELFYQEIVFLT